MRYWLTDDLADPPYPVLAEIRSFGPTTFDLTDAATVLDVLHSPDDLRRLLDANETAVREHFDLVALPAILMELIECARAPAAHAAG